MPRRQLVDTVIDLVVAFRTVVEALDDGGVEHVVVGSTAAAAWGVARTTRDIDLVATMSATDVDRFLAAIEHTDLYVPEGDARRAAGGGSFNVLHTRSGGKVDVFVAPPEDAFTRSRMERRVRMDVLGVPAWVATPEDVVLATLRWRLESRSTVQWRDCAEIAATQLLDEEYLWSWADTLGVRSDLTDLLEQTRTATRREHGNPTGDGG